MTSREFRDAIKDREVKHAQLRAIVSIQKIYLAFLKFQTKQIFGKKLKMHIVA